MIRPFPANLRRKHHDSIASERYPARRFPFHIHDLSNTVCGNAHRPNRGEIRDIMDQMESPSDLDLLRRARQGHWEAFETLVNRLEPRVFALTMRLLRQRQDAEDATQQTFLKVMENLESFREEARVSTWVLRIATNHALTMLRKRRPERNIPLEVVSGGNGETESPMPHPEFIAQWHDNPADLAERSEVKRLLESALDELDEKYRVVFALRDMEQFSTRETAELLGISESNVKVRLLRARLQLRERLTHTLGDEKTRVPPAEHHH